jgi:hypothetical protein
MLNHTGVCVNLDTVGGTINLLSLTTARVESHSDIHVVVVQRGRLVISEINKKIF